MAVKKAKAVSVETPAQVLTLPPTVVLIPLDRIERHPKNRIVTEDSVEDLAALIAEHGQRDPGRVRDLGEGRYQLLSGERRFVACRVAGKTDFRAEVVTVDDATALAEVALGNAGRKDLDPIERADLLEELTRSKEEGGGGLTKAEAGKMFGLLSESGVKNAMRLAKLSPSLRALVSEGVIPERAARKLVPYSVSIPVMDAIAKDLNRLANGKDYERYELSETISGLCEDSETVGCHWIEDLIREISRPVDPKDTDGMGYPNPPRAMLFDPKPVLADLQIIELPGYRMGKRIVWKRAMNCKLWDELNAPFEKSKEAKGKGKSKQSKDVKLTPAQVAADDRRKAKESLEKLQNFTKDIVGRLLRCTMAESAEYVNAFASLPWLVAQCSCDLSCTTDDVYAELKLRGDDLDVAGQIKDLDQALYVSRKLWARLLWPVSESVSGRKSTLAASGSLPDRIPFINLEDVQQLAKQCGTSIEYAWKRAATQDTDQRRLIHCWLMRHTKAQLQDLRSELNVSQGSSTMGRPEFVECILSEHRPGKPLPIPAMLTGKKKGK